MEDLRLYLINLHFLIGLQGEKIQLQETLMLIMTLITKKIMLTGIVE